MAHETCLEWGPNQGGSERDAVDSAADNAINCDTSGCSSVYYLVVYYTRFPYIYIHTYIVYTDGVLLINAAAS